MRLIVAHLSRLVEPIFKLIVLVSVLHPPALVVSEDTIGCRLPEKRATRVKIALPILLHHSVHNMGLHYLEGVQSF